MLALIFPLGCTIYFDQHSRKVQPAFGEVCGSFTFIKAVSTIINVSNKRKLEIFLF